MGRDDSALETERLQHVGACDDFRFAELDTDGIDERPLLGVV